MNAALGPIRFGELLRIARLQNASDIHLAPGMAPVLRVDGILEVQSDVPVTNSELAAMAAQLLDTAASSRLESHGDVTVTHTASETGSVRIHAYRTSSGITMAVRMLAPEIPCLEALHLPVAVERFSELSQGLVIFAGPTGSGKSTALAAVVERMNRTQRRHIITVEDPIEYRYVSRHSSIAQREIGRDVRSYADAIYGSLRSDPDAILVGEMREPKTMRAALTAAETGHLVLTTLHTGDCAQTVDRILGSFTDRERDQVRVELAQSLSAVVCLRLVPRAFAKGRRSAAEVLVANDGVRHLIRDGKTQHLRNVIATSRQSGMQTLEMHLSDLVTRREITIEAAKAATERPGELRSADAALC